MVSSGSSAKFAGQHSVSLEKDMRKGLAVGKSMIQSDLSDGCPRVGQLAVGVFQPEVLKIGFESCLGIFLEHVRNIGRGIAEGLREALQSQSLSIVFLYVGSEMCIRDSCGTLSMIIIWESPLRMLQSSGD